MAIEIIQCMTKKQVLEVINGCADDDNFCPDCFHPLAKAEQGMYFCPNELCENDEIGYIRATLIEGKSYDWED